MSFWILCNPSWHFFGQFKIAVLWPKHVLIIGSLSLTKLDIERKLRNNIVLVRARAGNVKKII